MTFVSGYRMIFNLLKLEQVYSSILCITNVLSSTIIIVSKIDKVWPRNAIATDYRPTYGTYGTVRKGKHIFKVPIPSTVNKLCSDNTEICLDIGSAF